jgi:hypothetical protein
MRQLYHSTPETQTDEAYTHPEGELIEVKVLPKLTK